MFFCLFFDFLDSFREKNCHKFTINLYKKLYVVARQEGGISRAIEPYLNLDRLALLRILTRVVN